MADYNEIRFEQEIAEHLAAHGWLYSPNDDDYDRERALFPNDVFEWLADTQPDELAKVVTADASNEAQQRGQVLEAPQVFRRSYAGCGSRLRVA